MKTEILSTLLGWKERRLWKAVLAVECSTGRLGFEANQRQGHSGVSAEGQPRAANCTGGTCGIERRGKASFLPDLSPLTLTPVESAVPLRVSPHWPMNEDVFGLRHDRAAKLQACSGKSSRAAGISAGRTVWGGSGASSKRAPARHLLVAVCTEHSTGFAVMEVQADPREVQFN